MMNIIDAARTKFATKLFPNTPIEIELDGDRIQFAVEGQWDSFEHEGLTQAISLRMIGKRLNEILLVNANYWNGQFQVNCPEWEGWEIVEKRGLCGLKPRYEPSRN